MLKSFKPQPLFFLKSICPWEESLLTEIIIKASLNASVLEPPNKKWSPA